MKFKSKSLIIALLVSLTMISAFSCKKNKVKKIAVDSQFAVALYSDTISFMEIITDMDSATKNWLRVRNDSIFVFYVDTIKSVLKASDLLSNIEDVSFSTNTPFTMPEYDPTNNHDTVVGVDRFMTIPFYYDGYNIEDVLLRGGEFNFDFNVTPTDIYQHLKRLEIFSNQIVSPEGDTLKIIIDYDKGSRKTVNMAGYHIKPENDTVAFGAKVTIHVDSGIYEGGEYECFVEGGLQGVNFKTIYGTIDKPFDSVFNDKQAIDFGIAGLTGSAVLPIPTIKLDYCNTFGLGAISDVTKLQFVNTRTGHVKNLLAADMVEVTVHPTQGEWCKTRIEGLTENIDALAGYTRLDFGGHVTMDLNNGNNFSISDTSTVDIAADIEMPMSFKLSDLCYTDTIAVNFAGNNQSSDQIDDYIDQIEFFIDYNSKIKIDLDFQAIFMKNNIVIDSLFTTVSSINYSTGHEISTLPEVVVTGRRLQNVLHSNFMVLRVAASTDAISPEPVMMMDTDAIFLRMRIRTKTSEFNLNDNE